MDDLPKFANLIQMADCPIINFEPLINVENLKEVIISYREDAALLPLIKFRISLHGTTKIEQIINSYNQVFSKENLFDFQQKLFNCGLNDNARWKP